MFPGYDSTGPFHQNTLRVHLDNATQAAKLPHTTIHDLRHTAASGLLNLGCLESYIAAFLGHKVRGQTAHYARTSVAALRPFVQEWADLVLGPERSHIARLGG